MSIAFLHRMPNGDLHVSLDLDITQTFHSIKIDACTGDCGYVPARRARPLATPPPNAEEALVTITTAAGEITTVLTDRNGTVLWERRGDWSPIGRALAGVWAKKNGYTPVLTFTAQESLPLPTPDGDQAPDAPECPRMPPETEQAPEPFIVPEPPAAAIVDSGDPFVQEIVTAKAEKRKSTAANSKRRYLKKLPPESVRVIAKTHWGLTDTQAATLTDADVVEFIITQEFGQHTPIHV